MLLEQQQLGLPGSKVGYVNNRGGILLKETDSGELIGLQFPGSSDDESRSGIDMGEEEGSR